MYYEVFIADNVTEKAEVHNKATLAFIAQLNTTNSEFGLELFWHVSNATCHFMSLLCGTTHFIKYVVENVTRFVNVRSVREFLR